jgi:hypothetical protein
VPAAESASFRLFCGESKDHRKLALTRLLVALVFDRIHHSALDYFISDFDEGIDWIRMHDPPWRKNASGRRMKRRRNASGPSHGEWKGDAARAYDRRRAFE